MKAESKYALELSASRLAVTRSFRARYEGTLPSNLMLFPHPSAHPATIILSSLQADRQSSAFETIHKPSRSINLFEMPHWICHRKFRRIVGLHDACRRHNSATDCKTSTDFFWET